MKITNPNPFTAKVKYYSASGAQHTTLDEAFQFDNEHSGSGGATLGPNQSTTFNII